MKVEVKMYPHSLCFAQATDVDNALNKNLRIHKFGVYGLSWNLKKISLSVIASLINLVPDLLK